MLRVCNSILTIQWNFIYKMHHSSCTVTPASSSLTNFIYSLPAVCFLFLLSFIIQAQRLPLSLYPENISPTIGILMVFRRRHNIFSFIKKASLPTKGLNFQCMMYSHSKEAMGINLTALQSLLFRVSYYSLLAKMAILPCLPPSFLVFNTSRFV